MSSEPRLAQLEVADADGRGTRLVDVYAWPLRIGRALDNDLVLPDAHVAAYHASIEPGPDGQLRLVVGETRNGARIEEGMRHRDLRAGEQAVLPPHSHWRLGQTRFSLRTAQEALAPELPLAPGPQVRPRWWLPALAAAAVAWLLLTRWVQTEPDAKWPDYVMPLLAIAGPLAFWVFAWGLLSKLFSGRLVIGVHLRLALAFWLTIELTDLVLSAAAYSFDWPLLSHLRGTVSFAIVAVWVTQHIALVQPQRARRLRGWVVACALLGLAVTMAISWRRNDRVLEELYAPNLMPPAWRLVAAKPAADLVGDLKALEQPLRERAAKAKAEDFEP